MYVRDGASAKWNKKFGSGFDRERPESRTKARGRGAQLVQDLISNFVIFCHLQTSYSTNHSHGLWLVRNFLFVWVTLKHMIVKYSFADQTFEDADKAIR